MFSYKFNFEGFVKKKISEYQHSRGCGGLTFYSTTTTL